MKILRSWLRTGLVGLVLLLSGAAIPVDLAQATVNEVTAGNRYIGNGSATVYSYTFKILVNTDIEVLVDGVAKVLTTDYTVSGVGSSGGGSVTFLTAPANLTAVTLLRKQGVKQTSVYTPNEGFPAARIEKDFDKQAMIDQQQTEALIRALKFGKKSIFGPNIDFPDPVAGKYVRATASAYELVDLGNAPSADLISGDIKNVNDYASFAAAITAIGGTQTTLYIPQAKTVSANVTVPSNVTLWFLGTGAISCSTASVVIGIKGPIVAVPEQIFSLSGGCEVSFTGNYKIADYFFEWWGAKADHTKTDNEVPWLAGLKAVGGPSGATWAAYLAGTTSGGAHARFQLMPGMYLTSAEITIGAYTWIELAGASAKGSYLYQIGGTGSALKILGAFYQNDSAIRKSPALGEGGVLIHDLSIGSRVGHGVQIKDATRPSLRNIWIFSAGVASNFLDLDGASVVNADDIKINGNDVFPDELEDTAFTTYPRTRGLRGVYTTSRVDGDGRFMTSGEIWFRNLLIEGQQTTHAFEVDQASGADFTLYPVVVDGGEMICLNTFSCIKANGIARVHAENIYMEASGTSDCFQVNSTQGDATTLQSALVTAINITAPTCRLNLNGDGTRKPGLIVKGGRFLSLLSASGVFSVLDVTGAMFTSQPASTYANYTNGDYVRLDGNNIETGSPGVVTNYPLNLSIIVTSSGEGNSLLKRYVYAGPASGGLSIYYRKARGTLQVPTDVGAGDAAVGHYWEGYANSGWRAVGYQEVLITAIAGSNLTGQINWHLRNAGVDTIAMIMNPTNITVGATTSNATALFNVNGGQTQIGPGNWPTVTTGQSANRVLIQETAGNVSVVLNRAQNPGTDFGANLNLGARGTDNTDDYASSRLTGARENATSGNFATYLDLATSTSGGTVTRRVRLDSVGNMKLAGTAVRGTTEGTNHLDIFDGTAPVGTLANGISLYSTAGELRVMDAGGTATLLSPHDDDGYWVFDSKQTATGRVLHIDMERMMKELNDYFGWNYFKEYVE